ncbi:hypothetical protein DFH06DRAFT_129254 [Mycena polygramma]|nr:hypothetical protein DFH06DRAFT_129254 [Mycena polygramma]
MCARAWPKKKHPLPRYACSGCTTCKTTSLGSYTRHSKMNPLWNSLLRVGFKDGQSFLAYVDLLGTGTLCATTPAKAEASSAMRDRAPQRVGDRQQREHTLCSGITLGGGA